MTTTRMNFYISHNGVEYWIRYDMISGKTQVSKQDPEYRDINFHNIYDEQCICDTVPKAESVLLKALSKHRP